ncbi:MAG TPA: response regulator [Myxococcaceae bacterium]|nr:response regulator [Myxococcaceae bacterium]
MKTILFVDDDQYMRAKVASVFELYRGEFTLVLAAHGVEAMQVLEERHVDLVITDLWMPVMDGFQLLVHMLNRRPELPVMVLSTRNPWGTRGSLGLASQVHCVAKPLSAQVLFSEVRAYLGAKAAAPLSGLTLLSLLQLLGRERKTSMLQVAAGTRSGTLYVLSGEVVHARTEEREGEAALFEMLGWLVPRVRLSPALSALRLTIDTPTEKLLSSASLFQKAAPVQGPSRTEPAPAKEWRPERPSRPLEPVYEKSPWTSLI